jgi:hypothetical protein
MMIGRGDMSTANENDLREIFNEAAVFRLP